MTQTQHDLIINYIKQHGSITPYEAFLYLKITKLSTRIGEIERKGTARFKRKMIRSKDSFGDETSYMRYWLEETNG